MRALTSTLARFLVPALVLIACTGCQQIMENKDARNDAGARKGYYEQSAKTYYDGGRYEQSARMWQKVLDENPDDQWAKFGQAKALHMVGTTPSLRAAEEILCGIMCLDWCHPTRGDVKFEVQTTLGSVYSDLADFYDRDLRSLQARLARDPNADAQTLRCQIERQKQLRDQLLQHSIPIWGQVLACSPDNQYALAGIAKAHLIAGTEEAGVRYAQRYLCLSQQSQVRWKQQMKGWEERAGRSNVTMEQRRFFQDKIFGARRKEIGMHLLLAAVYMRREQYHTAIASYDAVMKLDAGVPATYVERAQAYAALGVYDKAVSDLEEYLKMTDPQKQRKARVNAADLLDRYRRLAGRGGLFEQNQPRGRGGMPPPRR